MSAADVAGREYWCAGLPARPRVIRSRHLVRGPGATALGRSDLATPGSARLRNHTHGISLLPIAQGGCKMEGTSTEAAPTQRQLGAWRVRRRSHYRPRVASPVLPGGTAADRHQAAGRVGAGGGDGSWGRKTSHLGRDGKTAHMLARRVQTIEKTNAETCCSPTRDGTSAILTPGWDLRSPREGGHRRGTVRSYADARHHTASSHPIECHAILPCTAC